MRVFLALLVVTSAVTADAQRRRLPRGVQILRYGQGIHGVGSPTGEHFAYWGNAASKCTTSRSNVAFGSTTLRSWEL